MVSTQVEAIIKKQEVDSLTEKLECLDTNDTKRDKPNFLDDIKKQLLKNKSIWSPLKLKQLLKNKTLIH